MGRIVTPRVDTARFYRRGVKLDPSMQKKFGAQELQLLTKAIDAAVAIGGKIAGATQRRSAEMGAGREAREAAAREWGGMGGAKAMEAVQAVREGGVAPVSTQAAAAELASEAGVTAPAAAAPVEQFVAGATPAPAAAAPAVPVQRRGAAPVVAQPGAPAPEDIAAAHAWLDSEFRVPHVRRMDFADGDTIVAADHAPPLQPRDAQAAHGLGAESAAISAKAIETLRRLSDSSVGPDDRGVGHAAVMGHPLGQGAMMTHLRAELERANDMAWRAGDKDAKSLSLLGLSRLAKLEGDPATAQDLRMAAARTRGVDSQSIDEALAGERVAAESMRLSTLGRSLLDQGQPQEALESFERANHLAWEAKDEGAKAWSLFGMSRALARLGRDDEASAAHSSARLTMRGGGPSPPAPSVAIAPGPPPLPAGPTVTVPSPAMAAQPPAPAPAPAAAPAPVPATSLEQQLMRERRAEVERESKRQQLFRPEALARMRPGELQAVLRFAKTPQEAVAVMRAVRESPDVQPTALSDLWTDGHVKRAQKAVAAGWKPPAQKDPGAMSKRLANIRNIESNIEYRNQLAAAARAKAERAAELHEHALRKLAAQADRAERKLKGASRRVIRRDPEGSQILLELNEHRKHYVAYTEGTGEWSDGAIYNLLASRSTPPPGGWTSEEISDERERLWRQKIGDLYGETAESAEMATLRRLGGSKGRKALRKIVTGTADDIFRASKEANLVTRQEAKIGQADERLLQSDSRLRLAQQKAADSLSRAELAAIQGEAYAEAGDDLEEYSKAQARLIDEALEQKRAALGGGEGEVLFDATTGEFR